MLFNEEDSGDFKRERDTILSLLLCLRLAVILVAIPQMPAFRDLVGDGNSWRIQ